MVPLHELGLRNRKFIRLFSNLSLVMGVDITRIQFNNNDNNRYLQFEVLTFFVILNFRGCGLTKSNVLDSFIIIIN